MMQPRSYSGDGDDDYKVKQQLKRRGNAVMF
jgi:hypothetical protein